MKLRRRTLLQGAASAATLAILSPRALAQTYPSRPVRIMVGFAPGGSTDIIARVMGQPLSERLGQSVVIENRPGAGASLAAETVVRAAPDGYSLLLVSSSDTINATLYPKLSFNFLRDIDPVAGITRQPQVLMANPSLPAKTFPELIAYVRQNPGKITVASAGNGAISHLSGELLKMMAKVDMVHVPYRGAGPALTDLLAGHVQLSFAGMAGSVDYVRNGQLRAIAVTTATRSKALPDVPAIAEFLPGYEAASLFGIGVPHNTPAAIVERLNREINAVLADPKADARLADLGGTVMPGTAAQFGKLLADETAKWRTVIETANIKIKAG
jgi:tripartite-type tricarboxylate transporter receptor subunit TctC